MAALALALVPVNAMAAKFSVRSKPVAPSFRITNSIGSFTPAAADSRRALSYGRAGLNGSGFRFTPSVVPGSRRAVTVAIRARAATPAAAGVAQAERAGVAAPMASLAPAAYNLGIAVGWRRFALVGDVARVEGGVLPLDRESADVGVVYSGKRWSTRLQLGAERAIGMPTQIAGVDESYSVDLGGSYSLTRNLDVTGGLRYKRQRDRIEALADDRRDSQAVYVGTAFKF